MTIDEAVRPRPAFVAWPRGFPRPCLLLLIAERPSHGYDLLDRLDGLGAPPIDAGTLYRVLRAMERQQLVASRWEVSPSGPARRTYSITHAGRRELTEWAGAIVESHEVLQAYLRRFALLVSAD